MQKHENNNSKSEAALREERVLEFWKENKIFKKSLEKKSPKGEFVFYDGPVTANSKPVLHTMLPFSFKDVIPRYKTMRGYHVRRKGGWDTHGLPVELQIEKKLGFNSKADIENYGIAAFNKLCKDSVWEYVGAWKSFTERMGYWADQDNAYVTYYNNYIESVWNIVKKINEQNLLYKDYKVVPWCPRCGTALSSHELAQGYEDVKDLSVYVKFKITTPVQENSAALPASGLRHGQNFPALAPQYILAWTTTPWTLPGNVALAVGENIDYVKVKSGEEFYILAKEKLSIITEPYEIVEEVKGAGLVGLEYEPLYPYLANTVSDTEKPKLEKAYKVHKANFVTTDDGTGVVHTAVMYGQDDFMLGTEVGLPKHHLVGLDGKFLAGTGIFEGRFVKDEEVAVDIIKDLAHRGLLFKKEKYEHSYPHCWRCKTPLIYYARDSWYIRMSDPRIKAEMIKENKEINWEPEHIRDGRFGQWLEEIKDWAISRERYWGTPLPVWACEACKKIEVVGSVEDLKSRTKKSGNKYFVMRHGEAVDNAKHLGDPKGDPNNHLTDKGKKEIILTAEELKNKKIDFIFTSSFLRTKETAEVLRKELGLEQEKVIVEDRLHEHNEGDTKLVRKRMADFIYEIEKNYENKNILIISHGNPIWILQKTALGLSINNFTEGEMLHTGEVKELDFIPLPHNENYELDLHKPYIDEINLVCSCGGKLTRTKEVMDVWFDSGGMSFAQDHYPFDNASGKSFDGKELLYPADFISEGIDQTRGWFYTLHAVGILLGRGKAYKNVICLGHLLDAKGKKMSKSLGNVVEPFLAMDTYGVDTLRLWMYSINQPGESKNFDEKTVALLSQQIFGLLYNVLAFYELYRDVSLEPRAYGLKPSNILDKWILARLDELTELATKNLDNYKLLEPVRGMRDFIGDLSTWYLRRSRDRIKSSSAQGSGGTREGDEAKETLYYVLKTLAKLMAPLAPFAAEDIWLKLKNEDDEESVHLASWPEVKKTSFISKLLKNDPSKKIIENMESVRRVVTLGLEARQKTGIKVRQPLNQLRIKNYELGIEYADLIREELNVREVIFDNSIEGEVWLDIRINEELKAEGDYREFVRALQDMRKKTGLTPSDVVSVTFETNKAGKELIKKFEAEMKKTVLVSTIEFSENEGEKIKIDNLHFRIKIDK